MADTPEVKVKKKVIAYLKRIGAYYAMPVASGFGNAGYPDIFVCYKGRFVGIECKAKGNKPTALQLSNLDSISKAGGLPLIVDEHNVDSLGKLLGVSDERSLEEVERPVSHTYRA